MKIRYHLAFATAALLLAACSSDDDGAEAPSGTEPGTEAPDDDDLGASDSDDDLGASDGDEVEGTGVEVFAGCERGVIEPDFTGAPLAGPAVVSGALPSGQYLISTTYLQLGQDAASQQLFQSLIGPVVADLQTRPGLLALALGTSASCGTARTLAVWEDDAAMIGFVTGEAHGNAMVRVTDVSRGGSIVTHWVGDESSAAWSQAATRIAADDGPFY
jgi:hypothetical protein